MFTDAQMSYGVITVRDNPNSPYGLDMLTRGFANSYQLSDTADSNSSPSQGINVGSLNFDFQHLPKWSKALAAARAGSVVSNILLIGDNTTAGYGANNNGGVGDQSLSYPATLNRILSGQGIFCNNDSFFGDQNISHYNVLLNQYDPRITLGDWATFAEDGVCGGAIQNNNGVQNFSFSPVNPFDEFTIVYYTYNGIGTAIVNVDGGSSLGTLNFNSDPIISSQSFSCTMGLHTINIEPIDGICLLFGIYCSNSTKKGLQLIQLAHCNATSNIFTDAIASAPYNFASMLPIFNPALSIIDLGINDELTNVDIPTFTANLQNLITDTKAVGDVLLLIPVPSNFNQISADVQANFNAAIYSLAVSNNVALLDITKRWTNFANVNSDGYYTDNTNPSSIGYADQAQFIAKNLLSL